METRRLDLVSCDRCGSRVHWVLTLKHKRMPLEAKTKTIVTLQGETITGYESHFAYCELNRRTQEKVVVPAQEETRRLTHDLAGVSSELERVKAIAKELLAHVAADARELDCACTQAASCWRCISARLTGRASAILDPKKAPAVTA